MVPDLIGILIHLFSYQEIVYMIESYKLAYNKRQKWSNSNRYIWDVMTAMPIIYVICIRNIFASNLTTISGIDNKLDKEMFNLPYEEVIVDFSGIDSVSPEFANHHLLNKSKSGKMINEVNIPLRLQNM